MNAEERDKLVAAHDALVAALSTYLILAPGHITKAQKLLAELLDAAKSDAPNNSPFESIRGGDLLHSVNSTLKASAKRDRRTYITIVLEVDPISSPYIDVRSTISISNLSNATKFNFDGKTLTAACPF